MSFPHDLGKLLLIVFIVGSALIFLLKGVKHRRVVFRRFLLILWYSMLYGITVIRRPYKEDVGHNFKPFWSYFESLGGGREDLVAEIIMNVIFFIPLGVLLRLSFYNIKWWQVILISLFLSSSIELLQLLLRRGYAEFDDLFHNVLGSLLGYGLFLVVKMIYNGISKKRVKV